MKKSMLYIVFLLYWLVLATPVSAALNLSGSWSGFGYSFQAQQSGNSLTLIATDGDIKGKISFEGTITGNTVVGRQIIVARGCPNLERYITVNGTISPDGNSITITYTNFKYDQNSCVSLSGDESQETGSYTRINGSSTQAPQIIKVTPTSVPIPIPSVEDKTDQLPVEDKKNNVFDVFKFWGNAISDMRTKVIGGNPNSFDCQKFWESLSDDDGLTIGGPRQGSISNISGWKFSSKKKTVSKVSGDSCDIGGIRYDTDDSEGEAKTGFEINVSYFQNQEEAKDQLSSLKADESVKVEDQSVSGDTYSMRTVKLDSVEGRPNFLASGNFGRTAGKLGNCVITLTHTWYALAYQSTGDNYKSQAARMDEVMGMTKEGWQALSEAKELQQFCGGKASDSSSTNQKSQQAESRQPQSDQTGQQEKQNKSGEDNNPFNIFAINPFEAWLKLKAVSDIPQLFADAYVDIFYEHALWGPGALEQLTIEDIFGGTLGSQLPSELKTAITVKDEEEAWAFLPNYVFPDKENITVVKGQGQLNSPDLNQFIPVTSRDTPLFITYIDSVMESTSDMVQLRYSWAADSGAVINVSPQSEVMFLKPTQDEKTQELKRMVKLNKGEIEFKVKQANKKEKFGIQTDFLELIVIGTHFWVKNDPEKKQTLVGVYEGKVEVVTKDGKITIITPDGNKPGVVVVVQKLSITKLILVGAVLVVIIGGVFFFFKRRENKTVKVKKTKWRS